MRIFVAREWDKVFWAIIPRMEIRYQSEEHNTVEYFSNTTCLYWEWFHFTPIILKSTYSCEYLNVNNQDGRRNFANDFWHVWSISLYSSGERSNLSFLPNLISTQHYISVIKKQHNTTKIFLKNKFNMHNSNTQNINSFNLR